MSNEEKQGFWVPANLVREEFEWLINGLKKLDSPTLLEMVEKAKENILREEKFLN